eukprot:c12720_g1_i1 orf=393-581(+)
MKRFLEALLKDDGCKSNRVSQALKHILHRQSSYQDKLHIFQNFRPTIIFQKIMLWVVQYVFS